MSDGLTELEENILNAVRRNFVGAFDTKRFIEELRQILPPTCTANERKFLDRVRETYKYSPGGRSIYRVNVGYDPTILYPQDFPDIDLKELVE